MKTDTVTSSKPPRRIPRWLWLLIPVGLVAGIIGAIFLSQRVALAAPAQPIDFSHQVHAEAGLECLFCHPSAMRSDVAGIPSVQRCMGCHALIATDEAAVQEVAAYWERGEPIPWQRVTESLDFVFFSHQPHLLSGLNCETCHGDVARMSVARNVVVHDMGWCLECHLDQPEEKVARLADCLACHE